MFRGKESLKRIELSRLVQELLNFGVFGSLQLWGVGGGWLGVSGCGWGWLGVHPTDMDMHMRTHACVVNMIISCKWPPPLGESLGISYDVICACMCVHVHVCGRHPLTTPHPPPTPQGGPPESVKIQ